MADNYAAINRKRQKQIDDLYKRRINETARLANELQREHGITRSEALRVAERLVLAAERHG